LSGGVESALEFLKNKRGSTARVLKATVRNLDRDREHIEDIVAESILHESSRLDKFGSAILVIAAVSPLLGLLGTVTGMIATFDIITEFGTGDPKLLSGGISIALVTTELGLIVAIPILMVGNLLSGWAEKVKDSMEHSALHLINEYNKQK
jgi:biopolymer transport protein ExbB